MRAAEAVVSELWVSARQRPGDDARFYHAVERRLAITDAAIRDAASAPTRALAREGVAR